ncbi:MAG: hypothetical protein K9G59_04175 [Caulobacter sp.]|nr:hypothetical protein [Caulobacter sp.]
MNGFWKTWMRVWCWVVLAFGLVLALAAVPALDAAPRLVIGLLGGDPDLLDQTEMRFAFGLQGALTLGWGMTMIAMVGLAHTHGAAVWRSLTASVLVWYVIDSAISVGTGFPLNAVSNTLLTAGYLIPVLVTGVQRGGAVQPA